VTEINSLSIAEEHAVVGCTAKTTLLSTVSLVKNINNLKWEQMRQIFEDRFLETYQMF
jgi:hypothetical protein